MKSIRILLSLIIGLALPLSTLVAQEKTSPKAKLINRCEVGCSGPSAVMEATLDLLRSRGETPDAVAIRVCSKRMMPIALSIAATDPIYLTRWLASVHNYPPERVVFLRAEDCLGINPAVAATELWAVPRGAALPAAVESVRANQVRSEAISIEEKTPAKGTRDYRLAARELITKLRARPQAFGIVLGYYYRRPNLVMHRRLLEVRKLLEQSGLPRNRYFVSLAPWNGEYGVDPPDPEPRYPSVYIIEVARDGVPR
jgi:hypothetical protein